MQKEKKKKEIRKRPNTFSWHYISLCLKVFNSFCISEMQRTSVFCRFQWTSVTFANPQFGYLLCESLLTWPWVFVYVWVGLTPPCTDPHLAFLFGVRNGKRVSVNPEAIPCLYSRGNSFIHFSQAFCCLMYLALSRSSSSQLIFYDFFLTLLFPVSFFQALPLCLGVRGDTVKFTT